MRYIINNDKNDPAYIQLYHMIREDIISGVYKYGDKLPSKRNIAVETQTSVITVAHTYDLLIDEGYVESKEKSGYYVLYRDSDFYGAQNENINSPSYEDNNLSYEPISGPEAVGFLSHNILAKTMRKTLIDYGEILLERTPNQGVLELRKEISKYLARSIGIEADAGQIVVGAGAEYLYGLVAQLIGANKVIAIEKPSYDKIKKVYESHMIKVDELEMGKDGIVSKELRRTNANVLHVTPFHSFPSNVSASISKKNEYLKWAGEGRFIVEDNYDSELTVSMKMESPLFTLSGNDNVIFMNTFSKTIAPSLRVGYMILPHKLMDEFNEKLGYYSCTVPALEQYALCELLKSGDFERHINKVRRKLRQSMKDQ